MVLLKYSIHQPMRLSTSSHFIHNTFSSVKSAAIKSDQCTDHNLHKKQQPDEGKRASVDKCNAIKPV